MPSLKYHFFLEQHIQFFSDGSVSFILEHIPFFVFIDLGLHCSLFYDFTTIKLILTMSHTRDGKVLNEIELKRPLFFFFIF